MQGSIANAIRFPQLLFLLAGLSLLAWGVVDREPFALAGGAFLVFRSFLAVG